MSNRGDLLAVDDLRVTFGEDRPVVRSVSFAIKPGEAYGLVGESGSGKTITSRSILGLLPSNARVTGSINFGGRALLSLRPAEMRKVRGSGIAMIFQDPSAALNPLLRVGDAIAQVVRAHEPMGARAARDRAVDAMTRVGILDAGRRSSEYPHQFSGGMRQRVLIAMALAGRPSLLLADEPTTALDVIVQAEILTLLDQLRRDRGMSLLLVSHDLAVVAGVCDRVGVMYAGELVEEGPTADVLFHPRHPYTQALLSSVPTGREGASIRSIPGSPPEPGQLGIGCPFAPRCSYATVECSVAPIPFIEPARDHRARCIHTDLLA
jgi:oligopeptide/dipeptide ABC transporter ATP-binding protein